MSPPPSNDPAVLPAPPCVTVAPPPDAGRWFAEEVYAHDGQLKAHLRGQFPGMADVDDVVQESYLRLWTVGLGRQLKETKAFLFVTARNVARDILKKKRRAPYDAVADLDELGVIDDEPNALESLTSKERYSLLAQAVAALPPRRRQVVVLCKVDGLSVKEAAMKLNISVHTVAHQLLKGIEGCEAFLRAKGFTGVHL